MEHKLYVVYDENDFIYMVKAQNKTEAIDLVYSRFEGRKKEYTARDLEKELFNANGLNRKVVILS